MTDPFARVGLELELLAPDGTFRSDVAEALAERIGGRCEFGFKYHSENERTKDGAIIYRLSDAARVLDSAGRVLVTLVPDNTLRDGLAEAPLSWVMRTDDLRLALWVEEHCWSRDDERWARLDALKKTFGGFEVDGQLNDKYGHPLVEQAGEPQAWRRVCEFVTRPLLRDERPQVVSALLECAAEQGLTVPRTAALHAHYDAAPWQQVERLRRFLLEADAAFDAWRSILKPNPNCVRLGRQPRDVLKAARDYPHDRDDFFAFGAALTLAGADKAVDFNVLGVIRRYPKQPTFEVRCLPMNLDPKAILDSLETGERMLKPFVAD